MESSVNNDKKNITQSPKPPKQIHMYPINMNMNGIPFNDYLL